MLGVLLDREMPRRNRVAPMISSHCTARVKPGRLRHDLLPLDHLRAGLPRAEVEDAAVHHPEPEGRDGRPPRSRSFSGGPIFWPTGSRPSKPRSRLLSSALPLVASSP